MQGTQHNWLLGHLPMCCFLLTYLLDYFVTHGHKLDSLSLPNAQANQVHPSSSSTFESWACP